MDYKRVNRRTRMTRKERYKMRQRKRRRITLAVICVFLIVGGFVTNKIITYKKCQNISSAVEYYTTSNIDNSLLRVQNMELKFSDGDTAVVTASGLSNNSWKLENLYKLN